MVGRLDGTHEFARRIFAMHARYWLKICLGIVHAPLVVVIHPQPMHHAAHEHLVFADHRDIILRLASHHAGITSHARGLINGHAPGVTLVLVSGVNRESQWRLLCLLLSETRLAPVL